MVSTHLCNNPTGIRLCQALAQRSTITLKPTALLRHHLEIPFHAPPDARPAARAHIPPGVLAQQAHKVKVADDARAQGLEHVQLQIVVVLVQTLLGAAGSRHGARVGGSVVVDGDAVDVVQRPDEVVDLGRPSERLHERLEVGADELGFEADEDVDLIRILLLQA